MTTPFRPEDWLARPNGLAMRMRLAREAVGQAKDIADALGWDPAKVSRTEVGKRVPTKEDIQAWAAWCRLSEAETGELLAMLEQFQSERSSYRLRMKYGQKSVQEDFTRAYEAATRIRVLSLMYMPGVIQTPDFARRAMMEIEKSHNPPGKLEEAVAERMRRGRLLGDTSKNFEILIHQVVLEQPYLDADVTRAQLRQLPYLIGLHKVRFGILPRRKALRTVPYVPFTIFDDWAVIETPAGGRKFIDQEAEDLGLHMDALWEDAAEGDEARRLIEEAIEDLAVRSAS